MARERDHGICEPGPTRTDNHGFVNRRSPVQSGSPAPNSRKSEEWRPIGGLEGWYEVSSRGRVRRLAHRGIPAKILPGQTSVQLRFGGCLHSRTVAMLVAEAFLGPRPADCRAALKDPRKPASAGNVAYVPGGHRGGRKPLAR